MNYVGFVIAVFSIAIYVFVKVHQFLFFSTNYQSEATPVKPDSSINHGEDYESTPLINQSDEPKSWVDSIPKQYRRPLGIVMSLVSGIFYGVNFDPPTYLMDHGHSQNGLDYVFSHFCGIYITSTAFFVIYCMISKNKPVSLLCVLK